MQVQVPAPPLRWVFHMGAGKTGTSSIQFTLRDGSELLRPAGVWYLGLSLEHAPTKHFPWQVFGGTDAFHSLPQEVGEQQLRVVLQDTVRQARAAGVHTVIWSSESFFDRNDKAIRPLQELVADGVDLQLVTYVRRHDAWARSAYVQWAIKHKTAPGPVLPFQEWIRRRRPFFAPTLNKLNELFPGRLVVRNLDQAGDAVADFLALCGLDTLGLTPVRDNVAPSDTETLMRAVFNDGVRNPALPMLFDRVVGRHLGSAQTPTGLLARLMPTAADLSQVVADCELDRRQVNQYLQDQQQDGLRTDALRERPVQVDSEQLLLSLVQLCMDQARRIDRLEKRLTALDGGRPRAGAD